MFRENDSEDKDVERKVSSVIPFTLRCFYY